MSAPNRPRSVPPLFEPLEPRLMLDAGLNLGNWFTSPPVIVGTAPAANTHMATASTHVSVIYDQDVDPASASDQTFVVHTMQTGRLLDPPSTISVNGDTVTLAPAQSFHPGEFVQATATTGIQNLVGHAPAHPLVWQFRTQVTRGTGLFSDSGQRLGRSQSVGVGLGDLDGDGDLDAFVTNGAQPDTVWVNDGGGSFSDSGQRLGCSQSVGVGLGDLDGDGDLDAFVANWGDTGADNKVWLNDGQGSFSDSGQSLGTSTSNAVALGDLDGDGDLDAFVTNGAQPDKVWVNDGGGSFTDSGQSLGTSASNAVALGDLDGDGDLDAFVTNGAQPDMVWVNDGGGSFSDSGQRLGSSQSVGVGLGDLDGDGDLDAFVTNGAQLDKVWLNDGQGSFTDSGQSLGTSTSNAVALGDLDGDGDLDAFVASRGQPDTGGQPDTVWVNDGHGSFSDSGQVLGTSASNAVALGDLDGDGDLDAFVANSWGEPDLVWVNQEAGEVRPVVASVGLNQRVGRTISSIEPSGIGVRTIEVTFSEPVNFDNGSVTLETYPDGIALTPQGIAGSGTDTMTITFDNASVVDTWVKVTLHSGAITDLDGNALDGEPNASGSGRGYIYDAGGDLPTGDGTPGGDAVFYVGSLRADMYGYGPGDVEPDGEITPWDITGFTQKYLAGHLDADMAGYGPGQTQPDADVNPWDISGFTSRYLAAMAAGTHLDPLPTEGEGAMAAGTPARLTADETLSTLTAAEVALLARTAEPDASATQPVAPPADVLPALATVSVASEVAPVDGFATALAAESANSAVLTAWPPPALRPVAEADRAAAGDLLDPLALPALDIRL